ncbi:MAG: hypothetical protein A2Z34_08295, partial [Planctomycetes bacterium RBG_16_59_8]
MRQKLEIVRKMTGLTQTKLADKIGVSFPAFNNWWTGKSIPRAEAQAAIDAIFLDVTGQKIIPADVLRAKKSALLNKAAGHKNIVREILRNPDIRDQLVLKLTYHSNRIEGSTLTEPETSAILFQNTALPNRSLTEHLEAKNHQTALAYLLDYLSSGGAVGEALVLKLHGIVVNSIMPDAGTYRRHAVRIVGVHLPTANYLKIPGLIAKSMRTAAHPTDDVIAVSANIHSQFEQIHPFADGNGRVGRLLMNAMLLKADLAPAIIRLEQKQLYYTYLHKAQTTDDRSLLEHFICDAITDGF